MMQKIPKVHPSIYKVVMEQKFVVKTSAGYSSAVAPDMKLEQSGPRRLQVVSLVKQNNVFVNELKLAYHRFLTSVKGAVSSQDQFWQRKMQQHVTRNCEART